MSSSVLTLNPMGTCSSFPSSEGGSSDCIDGLVFQPPLRNLRGRRQFSHQPSSDGNTIAYSVHHPPASGTPSQATDCVTADVTNPKKVLIFAHGNACDLFNVHPLLRHWASALGVTVVGFDYPGYGESTGTPSEAGAYRALDTVVDWVKRSMKLPISSIFLCGQSLGTGVVAHHAFIYRGTWDDTHYFDFTLSLHRQGHHLVLLSRAL